LSTALTVPALLSLLPVLGLLGALVHFESFKLVSLRMVVVLVAVGGSIAVLCYFLNGGLIAFLGMDLASYSRYVSPLVEEAAKGAPLVWMIRRNRIGFMVDAAIVGFALGCGFALAENLYALYRLHDVDLGTWIVRGFGTAIMHGGAAALFALIPLAFLEHDERYGLRALLPGYATAVLLHAAFNQLSRESVLSVPLVIVAVSSLLLVAYHRGEGALEQWLGRGFDADAELLTLLRSGHLDASGTGRYLATLRSRFDPLVVVDLLAYVRLFTELSMRAKGVLLMRENGFEMPPDPDGADHLAELAYLERSIGRTGLLALQPLLPMRRRALRQLLIS
jgi:RsiW-degrading membrane proteinase PrsW (M82 family)